MAHPKNTARLAELLRLDRVLQEICVKKQQTSLAIEQLKKNNFGWNSGVEVFQKLKKAMTTVLVLALPKFSIPFIVETDASGHGLGAVLMQGQCPIAYYSRVLPTQVRHTNQFMSRNSWR